MRYLSTPLSLELSKLTDSNRFPHQELNQAASSVSLAAGRPRTMGF